MLYGKIMALALAGLLAAPFSAQAEPDDDYLIIIEEAIKQNSPLSKMIIEAGKKAAGALDGRNPREIRRNLEASGLPQMALGAGMQALRGTLGDDTANAIRNQGEKWLQSYRRFLNGGGSANSGGGFDPYSARGRNLWPKAK